MSKPGTELFDIKVLWHGQKEGAIDERRPIKMARYPAGSLAMALSSLLIPHILADAAEKGAVSITLTVEKSDDSQPSQSRPGHARVGPRRSG